MNFEYFLIGIIIFIIFSFCFLASPTDEEKVQIKFREIFEEAMAAKNKNELKIIYEKLHKFYVKNRYLSNCNAPARQIKTYIEKKWNSLP